MHGAHNSVYASPSNAPDYIQHSYAAPTAIFIPPDRAALSSSPTDGPTNDPTIQPTNTLRTHLPMIKLKAPSSTDPPFILQQPYTALAVYFGHNKQEIDTPQEIKAQRHYG